jgi:uncharacterized protein YegP (UPF0339 family)
VGRGPAWVPTGMAAKFQVHHKPGKGYHFTLHATNGRVIATSEHYETHRSCLEGIESVRRNAADAVLVDDAAKLDVIRDS